MSAVLKISCQDQLHRVPLPDAEVTYKTILESIQNLYPNELLVAKYLDEENDLCTLCPASFSDFVNLSGQHNGKTILKLWLTSEIMNFPEPKVEKLATSGNEQSTGHLEEGCDENPFAGTMRTDCLEAFAFPGSHQCQHDGAGFRPKKFKFLLRQLHSNGLLDANSAAALGIHFLPKMLLFVIDHSNKVDLKIKSKLPKLKSMLEDLCLLVTSTIGLEQCEGKIAGLLDNGVSASEVLADLFSALDVMPLEAQVIFFKALYKSQAPRLHEWLSEKEERMPWEIVLPLEHHTVTCDGCSQSPLQGLRFQCEMCADRDLCAACFIKRDLLHDSECCHGAFHIVTPWGKGAGKGTGNCWARPWHKGAGKFKGMGEFWAECMSEGKANKGKGKCKGKGKGKFFGKGGFNNVDFMAQGGPYGCWWQCATAH